MEVEIFKNIRIQNAETREFLADAFFIDGKMPVPLVIFAHGYKGYKDWGAWNLMAERIAQEGYFVVKFNFSHNGTTIEQPADFADLEAFGKNNFTKEISDYEAVINYFKNCPQVDAENIILIGHSRGGGISLIEAYENEEVKALVCLAGVSHFGYRFPHNERLEDWREKGVIYSENSRTRQQMPHYFQFYEDYKNNEERFNIQYAAQHLGKPFLIIQGSGDETVKHNESELLHQWAKESELFTIENANHTFGAKEPWNDASLPTDLATATEKIIEFLNKNFK